MQQAELHMPLMLAMLKKPLQLDASYSSVLLEDWRSSLSKGIDSLIVEQLCPRARLYHLCALSEAEGSVQLRFMLSEIVHGPYGKFRSVVRVASVQLSGPSVLWDECLRAPQQIFALVSMDQEPEMMVQWWQYHHMRQ